MPLRRWLYLGGYGAITLILVVASWWNGALDEIKGNQQQESYNKNIGDLHTQISGLIETGVTLSQGLNQLREQVSKIDISSQQTSPNVNQNAAAKAIAGRVATLLAGRTIDPLVATKLSAALKKVGPSSVTVMTVLGDAEAFQYTTQMMQVFNKAGWHIDGPNQGVFSQPVTGLILQIRDRNEVPPIANAIFSAFKEANISVVGQIDPQLKPGEVQLLIGSKPAQ